MPENLNQNHLVLNFKHSGPENSNKPVFIDIKIREIDTFHFTRFWPVCLKLNFFCQKSHLFTFCS